MTTTRYNAPRGPIPTEDLLALAEDEMDAAETVQRWLDAGRGVIVFENEDLSSSLCGMRLLWPLDAGDAWPTQAPDGHWGLGWRYLPKYVHAGTAAPIPDDAPDWAKQ